MHPGLVRVRRPRHLVVADDVLAVERDAVALGRVARQPRERVVQVLGEVGRVEREALVLDADGVRVDPPVAGLPRDVVRRHHLRDEAVGRARDVVRADVVVRVLEDRERAVVVDLGVVDDDEADVEPVGGPVREVVVAVVAGVGAVLLVRRRHEVAAQPVRALGVGGLGRDGGRDGGQRDGGEPPPRSGEGAWDPLGCLGEAAGVYEGPRSVAVPTASRTAGASRRWPSPSIVSCHAYCLPGSSGSGWMLIATTKSSAVPGLHARRAADLELLLDLDRAARRPRRAGPAAPSASTSSSRQRWRVFA